MTFLWTSQSSSFTQCEQPRWTWWRQHRAGWSSRGWPAEGCNCFQETLPCHAWRRWPLCWPAPTAASWSCPRTRWSPPAKYGLYCFCKIWWILRRLFVLIFWEVVTTVRTVQKKQNKANLWYQSFQPSASLTWFIGDQVVTLSASGINISKQ